MEKKMDAAIMYWGYMGLYMSYRRDMGSYRDIGKEHGDYYIGVI